MSKKKKKKPVWRWIGEAALIFLSILSAFYVDNYREEKARQRTYLKHVEDFRYDLIALAGSMNFELNNSGNTQDGAGYLKSNLASLDSLELMLLDKNSTQLPAILTAYELLDKRLAKWLFASAHYDKLTLDYYYFIRNPALKSSIVTHRKDHLHRQEAKERVNELMAELEAYFVTVNFDQASEAANASRVFNNRIINTVRRIQTAYQVLIQTTQLTIDRDAEILQEIEEELRQW